MFDYADSNDYKFYVAKDICVKDEWEWIKCLLLLKMPKKILNMTTC